jgi:hypothetical protein
MTCHFEAHINKVLIYIITDYFTVLTPLGPKCRIFRNESAAMKFDLYSKFIQFQLMTDLF